MFDRPQVTETAESETTIRGTTVQPAIQYITTCNKK